MHAHCACGAGFYANAAMRRLDRAMGNGWERVGEMVLIFECLTLIFGLSAEFLVNQCLKEFSVSPSANVSSGKITILLLERKITSSEGNGEAAKILHLMNITSTNVDLGKRLFLLGVCLYVIQV